jgi:transcriptional regulator with XRE-family HTH domain
MTYLTRNYALGEYLLALRTRAKLTQAELAARLGVHRRRVQIFEMTAQHQDWAEPQFLTWIGPIA